MKFIVNTAELLSISDHELTDLLSQVYVEGGFTTAEIAA